MPVSGGSADKFGNRYEALWAIDQLLRIVDGSANLLTPEPIDPDESRGIEFVVIDGKCITEYWSVKRQTAKASGWTLSHLSTWDERGRAILGDLLHHVERSPQHHAVFASSLGAPEFDELRLYAPDKSVFEGRLQRQRDLDSKFRKHVLPLCGGDAERARAFLLRTRTHAVDQMRLLDDVHFKIRRLFYNASDTPSYWDAARGYLGDLLLESIHRPIDRQQIVDALSVHGIRLRDWEIDRTVPNRIDQICDAYTSPLKSDLINGTLLPLAGSESILSVNGTPSAKKVLVVADAGGGKSAILGDVAERLHVAGIPVLPIRFDQLPDGILTTTEMGHKLLLPESPAMVLAGVANGKPSVLLIDQLDAVSMASGRRLELWSLFDELSRDVARYPEMSMIVGCREFDLEHDPRMRKMKAEGGEFTIVKLQPLSSEQVDGALRNSCTDPSSVQATLKPILATPLHLSMFLSLPTSKRTGVHSRDELFDNFWTEGECRTDQRIGRKSAWTQVIDRLADWLSANRQLSAPMHVLDDYRADAAAMVSGRVIILTDNRYRFFHESFFDYAFARRFAAKDGALTSLLLSDEQHLFRRAQVRQVLAYLRAHDWPRYIKELRDVLSHSKVRFHIKRLVFQWLSTVPDPQIQEWEILQRLLDCAPDLRSHVRTVIAGHAGWFDVLDTGFFDAALSSSNATQVDEAVWIFGLHPTLEKRSDRVAALLKKYRKPGEQWSHYLRHVCRFGEVYHSPEMFDFFLSLIDDGTLDDLRPAFAANDSWWSTLHSMAERRPDLACEAIGHWFDRTLLRWRDNKAAVDASAQGAGKSHRFGQYLDQGMNGTHVIWKAAEAPLHYAKQMLPRVGRFVTETAEERTGRLHADPLWSLRWFGDNDLQVHSALLSALAKSLEALATTTPEHLDKLLADHCESPHDSIAYLVLRAWTVAPDVYAERMAQYLAADARRLKIGYSFNGGSGSYVSAQATRAASSRCSPGQFDALEHAILSFSDDLEARRPQSRGWRQLELLLALDGSRLSAAGNARLRELQRKFPAARIEPPRALEVTAIGSPISENAQAKMSDEHWLRAMRKYARVEDTINGKGRPSGGELQLARDLESRTKEDPIRFATLATRMENELPATYFDAIIRGIAERLGSQNGPATSSLTAEQAASVIRRVHGLPNRPCGRSIAWLIEKSSGFNWPSDVVDAVAWYAINDPDPEQEFWSLPANGGKPYYAGDPYTAGINSTRGAAAGAVAQLLFDVPERIERLESAVHQLTHDSSVAVRSCAMAALLAMLNTNAEKAISWFKQSLSTHPAIFRTPYVERLLYYAGYRDYAAIGSIIDSMLSSVDPSVVEAGARQACVLSLSIEAAAADAERVQKGTPTMRKAAAEVYARNIADQVVGAICRERLKPFFIDPDEGVRAEAASAFQHIAGLTTTEQADLLAAFLDSAPGQAALEPVVRALEDSPVQLPDLVCKLGAVCVEEFRTEGGDLSKAGAMVAMDLSKIIIRLYSQTEDPVIQRQCLTLIDDMESHHFYGMSDELRRLDR